MRAVALVHFYPPYRLAGSETMLHTMLKALLGAGHEAHVVTTDMPESPEGWTYEGVRAYRAREGQVHTAVDALKPDVLITHHQHGPISILASRRLGVPSIWIQHNSFQENRVTLAMQPDLTVFNTEWIARSWHQYTTGRWTVVHPPVWPSEHAATPGKHVTLVNLNVHKGVNVFGHMAQLFPDLPFLAVTGGHGEQQTAGLPFNVKVIKQTSNMRRDVWAQTRVLLMPSLYESYGMAAVEALASGIPVIAHPTPGLKEALGPAGIFADRDKPQEWAAALRGLMRDPGTWAINSRRSLERSLALEPTDELRAWVRSVESLVADRGRLAASA